MELKSKYESYLHIIIMYICAPLSPVVPQGLTVNVQGAVRLENGWKLMHEGEKETNLKKKKKRHTHDDMQGCSHSTSYSMHGAGHHIGRTYRGIIKHSLTLFNSDQAPKHTNRTKSVVYINFRIVFVLLQKI